MDWIRAIILGILQGLTEFLPVSSSAHLKIADTFFGSRTEVWFEVFLHAGTLCAVLFALKSDLIRLFVEALKMAGDLFRNLRIMIRRDRSAVSPEVTGSTITPMIAMIPPTPQAI